MPSAVDFFPCHIIELMNFVTRSDPYTGSASTVRFGVCPFLGMLFSSQLSSQSSLATGHCPLATVITPSSGVWYRTSSALGYDPRRRSRPAFRAPRDNAHRADPSHGRRGSAQSSAPAGYGQRPEYRSSLQFHSSGGPAPLCAAPSSASSASGYTRACTLRASADTIAEPDSPSYTGASRGQISPAD